MTQKEALQVLKTGRNVFLTGEPGAGKTYTINLFTDWLKENYTPYAITASTGIAATHIGGSTIHAWSGIGIKRKITESIIESMQFNHFLVARLAEPQVLIIDEVSMLDSVMIDNVDYVLRCIRGSDTPFGGMQVVFVGDFFQLPPVSREEDVKFAFESSSWQEANLTVCYLTEQHRQSDHIFLSILSAMRNGEVTEDHKKVLGACQLKEKPATQLYTHNVDVDRVNTVELMKLPGQVRTFTGSSGGVPFMVEQLKKDCLSPEVLNLKEGAIVMFTTNDFEVGYVNGTIGKVIGFTEMSGAPIIEVGDGEIVPPRVEWVREEKGEKKAWFKQYPLRLAWAITVHKSQGMSLDSASMDLSRTFEYGQGYVAISRVRSLAGLHLQGINSKAFEMHPKVVEQDKIFRSNNNDDNAKSI